jgi:Domain of unknown function (DUF4214)
MEAASGAIRIGLASGRPVGCTPLPIFQDFVGLVLQFEGISPADIAEGMRKLVSDDYPKEEISRRQRAWLGSNSWRAQANRIANIMRGNFEERHGVELRPPAEQSPSIGEAERSLKPATKNSLREMIEAEFNTLSPRDFVTLAHRRTFGRDPTPEEFARFERSGAATAADRWRVLREISLSAEMGGLVAEYRSETLDGSIFQEGDSASFINAAFRLVLLRDPDATEKERYLTALANDAMPRRQIVDLLMGSAEFRALSRPLRVVWEPAPSSGNAASEQSADRSAARIHGASSQTG